MVSQRGFTVWTLGGFALLWGVVLPFVCWGAWASPGHAHAAPHFVFVEPPSLHHPLHHAATDEHAGAHTAESTEADERPSGVAHPDSLILLLLLSVLLRMGHMPQPRHHTWPAPPRSLGSQPNWPTVPTPPPRLSAQFT